jgi:hypothetical protein
LGKFQFIALEEQYANRKSSLNSPFAPEEQYHFFAQRNNGPLGMTSGAICHLSRRITGACSAEIRVRRGGLCGFAALRPAPKNCGATNILFSSRKDAEAQRKGGAIGMTFRSGGQVCGLDQLMLKNLKQKKELHFCNSFIHYEPSRNSTGQACLSNQRLNDYAANADSTSLC